MPSHSCLFRPELWEYCEAMLLNKNHPANKNRIVELVSRNPHACVLNRADTIPFPRYFQNQLTHHHKAKNEKKLKETIKLHEKVKRETSLFQKKNSRKHQTIHENPLTTSDISKLTASNSKGFSSAAHENEGEFTLPILSEMNPRNVSKIISKANVINGIRSTLKSWDTTKIRFLQNCNNSNSSNNGKTSNNNIKFFKFLSVCNLN